MQRKQALTDRVQSLTAAVASAFAAHELTWANCDRCPLHHSRKRVVLFRGRLPCEVLFIGEAPGKSEDLIGLPFVGEAGKLLDRIVQDACDSAGCTPRIAFSNIVGCFPCDDESQSRPPVKKEITACRPRLDQLIAIAQPAVIVAVGRIAEKALTGLDKPPFSPPEKSRATADPPIRTTAITHPAAILRQDDRQSARSYKRCVLALSRVLTELNDARHREHFGGDE